LKGVVGSIILCQRKNIFDMTKEKISYTAPKVCIVQIGGEEDLLQVPGYTPGSRQDYETEDDPWDQ